MIGKASEIKTANMDVREINAWLSDNDHVFVIDIKFSTMWSDSLGGLPIALIIYKEGAS
jgi:hypothetical protein